MPFSAIHSIGMGTILPDLSTSAALLRSPFVQVKNLEDDIFAPCKLTSPVEIDNDVQK